MSEMTPARAAYEAHGRAEHALFISEWDEFDFAPEREWWETAAKAATDADLRWPCCPDGCGCRIGTDDADGRECGCDGPCTMECLENGYPDAPSYRELAVRPVVQERDKLAAAFDSTCERVRAVLDKALGSDNETGEGLAADVARLASQRDEARAQRDSITIMLLGLVDRCEGSKVITADEADEYRKLAGKDGSGD